MIIPLSQEERWYDMPDGSQLPYIDAIYPVLSIPSHTDITNGKRGDPCRCPYALWWIRTQDCTPGVVKIHGKICVADLPDGNGKMYVMRFILRDPSTMKGYDSGKPMPKHAILFDVPKPYETLAGEALAQIKHKIRKNHGKTKHRKKRDTKHTQQHAGSDAGYQQQSSEERETTETPKQPNDLSPKGSLELISNEPDPTVAKLRKSGRGKFGFFRKEA